MKFKYTLSIKPREVLKQIAKTMKKLHLIVLFITLAFLIYSCSPAYVATQPLDNDEVRPHSPSNSHVWIGGNWKYNRRLKQYNQGFGRWVIPQRGKTYYQGQWNSNSRGYYWVPGRWQ